MTRMWTGVKSIMRKFLLASHGTFARGLYNSVQIILGSKENISALCAYVDKEFDLKKQVKDVIDNILPEDELIVLTDIFGGSVNNEFMKYADKHKIHLICGMNLPLIIELITSENSDTKMLIDEVVKASRESIKYCNKTLNAAKNIEDEEF